MASCWFFSFCNNNREVEFDYKEFLVKTDYRKFPPYIKFNLDKDPTKWQNQVKEQINFIESSGIPSSEQVEGWRVKFNWEYADSLYKKFISANSQHPNIDVFRQYGSYIILAKLALFDEKAKKEKLLQSTKYYLSELTHTKYTGYGLLLYGLAKLDDLNEEKNSIKKFAAEISEYSKNDPSLNKKLIVKNSNELGQEVVRNDSLNKEYRNKITSF